MRAAKLLHISLFVLWAPDDLSTIAISCYIVIRRFLNCFILAIQLSCAYFCVLINPLISVIKERCRLWIAFGRQYHFDIEPISVTALASRKHFHFVCWELGANVTFPQLSWKCGLACFLVLIMFGLKMPLHSYQLKLAGAMAYLYTTLAS